MNRRLIRLTSVIALALSLCGVATAATAAPRILFRRDRGTGFWSVLPNGRGLHHYAAPLRPYRFWPVWSPDRSKIAYVQEEQIWIMDAASGDAMQITSGRLQKDELAWSPDGTRIAFSGLKPGIAHRHLFSIGANGTSLRRITSGPAVSDASPSWSPDGARLVFMRSVDGHESLFTIGRGGRGLFAIPDTDASYRPDWSPDGRWIVYDDGGDAIHLSHPDGSAEHVIPGLPQHYLYPTWSPDGRWIAIDFMTPRTSRVLRITPDGSRRVPIVGDPSDPADLMDW